MSLEWLTAQNFALYSAAFQKLGADAASRDTGTWRVSSLLIEELN